MRNRIVLPALTVLLAASTALAQGRAVFVTVNGGVTLPLASVRSDFGVGWNLGLGAAFPVTGPVEIRLEVIHARVADRTSSVDAADTPIRADRIPITASHFMDAGTVSLRVTPPGQRGRCRAYLLAGTGVYYRKVTLSSPGAGLAQVCNPRWFVCETTAVPVSEITGRRNSVGVGVSAGGGLSVALSPEVNLFIEARLHSILSAPAYRMPDGTAERATAVYLPISAGIRF
jgi:hypothetical protein